MSGVWQIDDKRENKYLVLRRDDTMPDWPWLVLGAPHRTGDPGVVARLAEKAP